MASAPHPFDPLSPQEISQAAQVLRLAFPEDELDFRVITLKEPHKRLMVAFLENEHSGAGTSTRPPRVAAIQVFRSAPNVEKRYFEINVDLGQHKIIHSCELKGKHPYIDVDYMRAVEVTCMADPAVQAEIHSLDLPKEATVYVEAWAYATDGMNDMSKRTTMCWFYMRLIDSPDANYYAYPLDVCAEMSEDLKVTRVYRLPSGEHGTIHQNRQKFDRRKIHTTSEYYPGLMTEQRLSTKPYQVVQPEGPSFTVHGNFIQWEKWAFRVGFNYREGMTLHDVRYDGRSLFYRISLAEMFVPYGDSRSPYTRKAAFDVGNDGAGLNANNLRLGCDCLGSIKYFDGWHTTKSGHPLKLSNAVCCHEIDDGILWKHTNFRTNNPVVVRSRVLVLQTIITVSNYEYIFAFHFSQDAAIKYEVRATGIMSTCVIDIGDRVSFGTIVAPGVLAPYHQHLFSLRIDPAIDGHLNSVEVEESIPMPMDDPKISNPFGVGYTTSSHIVQSETPLDLDVSKHRVFKLINENEINPVTGTHVGYQLVPWASQMLLSNPASFHSKRCEFGSHAIWITRYSDDELFPSGKYTMQSLGGEGIASWIASRQAQEPAANSVRNEDIVVWHTFGSTHNPRVEDWPVMPCEKMVMSLKPVNFFTRNPGLDVPISTQARNKSVLVLETNANCESGSCT